MKFLEFAKQGGGAGPTATCLCRRITGTASTKDQAWHGGGCSCGAGGVCRCTSLPCCWLNLLLRCWVQRQKAPAKDATADRWTGGRIGRTDESGCLPRDGVAVAVAAQRGFDGSIALSIVVGRGWRFGTRAQRWSVRGSAEACGRLTGSSSTPLMGQTLTPLARRRDAL